MLTQSRGIHIHTMKAADAYGYKSHTIIAKTSRNCVIIATEISDSTHLVLFKLGQLTSEVNAKMHTSNDK
ncbi:hypothetical protein V1478_005073 [Vespula squamosa]|uniref:Uncharacterized protein n=1 Tax=Vespula squamosa TaxID=30214 RepID=A0ABD2BDA0_VESSQ